MDYDKICLNCKKELKNNEKYFCINCLEKAVEKLKKGELKNDWTDIGWLILLFGIFNPPKYPEENNQKGIDKNK